MDQQHGSGFSVDFNHDDGPHQASALAVRLGETELFSYVFRPSEDQLESPRPYLHPVRTLSGDVVTLNRPHDHVWHKGISWSLPVVGPHNFWGGPTFVTGEGYQQLPNNGSMDHQDFTEVSGGSEARIAHQLLWHSQAGEPVVREARTLLASEVLDGAWAGSAWVLRFESAITNTTDQNLDLGSPTTKGRENAGYGGLFWRGPRAFTGGRILGPDFAGGEEFRGVKAPWAGFSGLQDETGNANTVVLVDGSQNPAHPPQWFARNEWFAGVNPAPFFSEEVPFAPGEELVFRYAVVIADGPAPQVADGVATITADGNTGAQLAALGAAALGQ